MRETERKSAGSGAFARIALVPGIVAVLAAWLAPRAAEANVNCAPPASSVVETDEYSFEIEPAAGASGDIVEVGVSLRSRLASRGFLRLRTSICHDPNLVELAGPPRYSEAIRKLAITRGIRETLIDELAGGIDEPIGNGLAVEITFDNEAYESRFPSDEPLLLFTLCYRLLGDAGAFTELRLCDEELATRRLPCIFNELHSWSRDNTAGWHFISTENEEGLIEILPGRATREECPPLSPPAKVYDLPQRDEDVNLRIEVGNAAASPGMKDVPVDLWVTADREYTSLTVPIDFDERYLRLAWAEERLPGSVTVVNNRNDEDGDEETTPQHEGWVIALSGLGRSRLAKEGARIRVATFHFEVLPEAAGVSETPLRVVTVQDVKDPIPDPPLGPLYRAGVTVHHLIPGGGAGVREPAPMRVTEGRMVIDPDLRPFLRGDAAADGERNITDAIFILSHLFLGGSTPSCKDSADVNDDGALNVTDVISLLQFLFLGAAPPPPPSFRCGPDPFSGDPDTDSLGCASYTPCEP